MGRFVFRLPDVGEGTAEAEIVGWHVKVGDRVEEDQILADIMTDKATVEITSPVAGTVIATHGTAGVMAPVGGPLVEFEVEGAGNAASAPFPLEGGRAGDGQAQEASPPPAQTRQPTGSTPTEPCPLEGEGSGSGGNYVFKLPDVGEGTAEAELVGWHVKVGDMVAEDQILADIMTDKATVEITSPVSGKVTAVNGQPGAMAPVGSVIVVL
ncbi:MAG TPA: biotin/lipoyl-containing protein, partial [Caulobacteraceae bacterium]